MGSRNGSKERGDEMAGYYTLNRARIWLLKWAWQKGLNAAGIRGDEMSKIATAEDIRRLQKKVKTNWDLCDFLGNCEAETMVAQTIQAAANNLKEHGEPFSFRGNGVFTSSGNGLIDNHSAYSRLLAEKLFIEAEREGKTVIFPTKKLIARLDLHFWDD